MSHLTDYDKLKILADLKEDWDSYGSPPIPKIILERIEKIINSTEYPNSIKNLSIIPFSGGCVDITWRYEDREYGVTILENGMEQYKLNKNEVIKNYEEGPFNLKHIMNSLRWVRYGR